MGLKIEAIKSENKNSLKEERGSILNREISLFGSNFSSNSKEDFYGELSVLLHSGIKLQSALELIGDIQKKKKHRNLINDIENSVVQGAAFSEALKERKEFTPYEYQAVLIGEQTGELPKIIDDLRAYFNRKNDLRRQLVSSLAYPIIVLFLAVAVVWFMLLYVVPMFVDIFKQNKVELPWLTQQIVYLSDFVNSNGWLLFIGIVCLIIIYRLIRKTESYRRIIGNIQLKIPILGNYLRKIYLIQFTQAMALLTYARIPVINGLVLVRGMIQFYPLQKSLEVIESDIIRGLRMDESFVKHTLYDKKMIALLKVAEETNQTEFIFQKLYDQYSAELKYKGQLLSTSFNFLLTLLVGLIVAIVLVAMYLPMFKLSSLIG